MIHSLFQSIINNINVRQNLSALRKELKDNSTKAEAKAMALSHADSLISLLSSDDAKTRKNTALLMGDLEIDEFAEPLFCQYLQEETLFVKSAYLVGLSSLDCSAFLLKLKSKLRELSSITTNPETKKHTEEELRVLTQLILSKEGLKPHTFCGYHESYDCILLTNRLHSSITDEQIDNGQTTSFRAGLRVRTKNIQELLDIRTYRELLFSVSGLTTCSSDPLIAANELAKSNLLAFLKEAHKETAPFYFRLELKNQMQLNEKSIFTKKLAAELERLTDRQLINSASNYEIEIRMIENKLHTYNVLVKLWTLQDNRFSYRKKLIPTSIRPDIAALLVELSKDYMIPDARILDPFCGVGTMLIERQHVVKGNTSYGLDISNDAIARARQNTENAGQIIHFVNRDFFSFTHEYLFDEIFTNMPFFIKGSRQNELLEIYENFFKKSNEVLTAHGTLILYSHNPIYIKELCSQYGYIIVKNIIILDIEGSSLVILKRKEA